MHPRDSPAPALWLLGMMALFSMIPEGAVLDWAALYLQQELGARWRRRALPLRFFRGPWRSCGLRVMPCATVLAPSAPCACRG